MRLSVLTSAAALLALAACVESNPVTSTNPPSELRYSLSPAATSDVIPGQYLVMFRKNEIPVSFAAEVATRGGSVRASHGKVGIAVVSGLDDAAATALAGRPDVELVSPDELFNVDPIDQVVVAQAPADQIASPAAPATAFFYARQWNMRAVSANTAWSAGKLGSASVTVAILDTGIDYDNFDLNGLVDLSRSTSFLPDEDAFLSSIFPGKHVITDLHYHGTHVASTVVSKAFVTAAVSSRTTLIGVKVCNRNGSCPSSAVLAGVIYATDQGADVMNLSLGGAFDRKASKAAKDFAKFIDRTFKYAYKNGTLAVVAAGNEATDLDANGTIYKTYCDSPNVVCVSATGPTASAGVNGPWANIDASAFYTNYGRAINVAAPGGNTGGAVWAACSHYSVVIPICQTGIFTLGAAGTSMAAPHVSGLAALIAAQNKHKPKDIRKQLERSADDLGAPGTDPFYGKGRINVARALGLN